MKPFDGLGKGLPECLRELRRNNSREWFHAHRDEYRHRVGAPMAALAEMLAPGMARCDSVLVKKLSRPQRDVRFSKDKSPYRTEVWLAFRRARPNWTEYPAFFFEATPEYCRWGMGYYAARPATMSALRETVLEDQECFLAALDVAAERGFALNGDQYKRHPPVLSGTPEEIADLIRRRNVYLCRTMGYEPPLLNSGLAEILAADFAALDAMYRFFLQGNRSTKGILKMASFTDPVKQQIWTVVRALNDAWTQGNPDDLSRFFHRDMVAITATDRHRLDGGAACVAAWKKFCGAARIHRWKEVDPVIHVHGNSAVVAYDFDMSFDMGGQTVNMGGRDMFFFVREGEKWWAVADQFSPYPA